MNSKSNQNVLIIDDTLTTTLQLELMLRKEGYNVTTANNVVDGLKEFSSKTFDYVIMDLVVPTEEDGIDLLRNLKNCIKSGNINTVVIVMSASPKEENSMNCKELGADYYLEKNENWKTELLKIISKRIKDEN